jgi:hypothetical protein
VCRKRPQNLTILRQSGLRGFQHGALGREAALECAIGMLTAADNLGVA